MSSTKQHWLRDCSGYNPDSMKLCKRGYCTAKSKFKVYPSAYANAYASQVCMGQKPDGDGVVTLDAAYMSKVKGQDSDLRRWFAEEWVNVCEEPDADGKFPSCGRSRGATLKAEDYPYCRPLHRISEKTPRTVDELGPKGIRQMCAAKRAIQPGVGGAPTRVRLAANVRNASLSFTKSARQHIEALLQDPPSSWRRLFTREGLPETPSVSQVVQSLLEKTAGGHPAESRGEARYMPPLDVRRDALKGVVLSHKSNYPSWKGIGLARAIQLATQPQIWERSVRRMYNFFTRNQRYTVYPSFGDDDNPSKSYLAWLNWGGTPGFQWSRGVLDSNLA